MELKIYSIRDVKASFFGRPFFCHNNGVAVRSFSDLVGDQQSDVNKHPGDFDLFHIGSYDDITGVITPLAQPVFLNNAAEFVPNGK